MKYIQCEYYSVAVYIDSSLDVGVIRQMSTGTDKHDGYIVMTLALQQFKLIGSFYQSASWPNYLNLCESCALIIASGISNAVMEAELRVRIPTPSCQIQPNNSFDRCYCCLQTMDPLSSFIK